MSTPEDILARLAMPKRLQALKQSGLMDTEEEEDFNRVTRLAQASLSSDVCLISLVDGHRQFFKSARGLPDALVAARETPLSHSICQHVVANGTPLVVEDARYDARVADNPAVRDLNVISYLGMPIFGPEGDALGSLCVINGAPRHWTDDETATLQDFARLLENVIKTRIYARDALRAATSNAVLAREYNHRIKNSYAVSAGLVRAAGRSATSVDALVRDCADRFVSLGRAQDLVIGDHETSDLRRVVEAVLSPFVHAGTCRIDGPQTTLSPAQVTPLALLLHELATNSVKYGALRDNRQVEARWRIAAPDLTLTWEESVSLSEGQSIEGGFGAKVLEIAARQLAGRISRRHTAGVMIVETVFPVEAHEAELVAPAAAVE